MTAFFRSQPKFKCVYIICMKDLTRRMWTESELPTVNVRLE